MEDVFYFTKSAVSWADMILLANEEGYSAAVNVTPSASELRITLDDTFTRYKRVPGQSGFSEDQAQEFWAIAACDDLLSLEPNQELKIAEYEPACCFIITYHVATMHALVRFLSRILKRYGGWIADDDDWSTVFNQENIEELARRQI